MGDRDADLADLAAGKLVVGVVAGLRRQVEGDRQAGLAARQVRAVERVRIRRRRVPRIGAEDPGLVALRAGVVHSLAHRAAAALLQCSMVAERSASVTPRGQRAFAGFAVMTALT